MSWWDELRHLWWRMDKISPDNENVRVYYHTKYSVAKMIEPESILEIGVRFGYSAFAMLSACPDAAYVGYDDDNGTHGGVKGLFPKIAEYTLHKFKSVALFKKNTQKTNIEGRYDLIHIDGDHTECGCRNDLLKCETKAKYLLVDDIYHVPEVCNTVIRFLNERNYEITIFDEKYRGNILIKTNYGESNG